MIDMLKKMVEADQLSKEQVESLLFQFDAFSEENVSKLVNDENFEFRSNHKTALDYYYKHNKEKFISNLATHIKYFSFFENDNSSLAGPIKIDAGVKCGNCGEFIEYTLENGVLSNDNPNCFEIKPYSFDIAFPSGKVLFADWPYHEQNPLNNLEGCGDEDINTFRGCISMTENHAAKNILHAYAGNTCPGIYRKKDVYHIGSKRKTPFLKGSRKIGWICTDLWWVTAVDYEVYKNIAQEKFGQEDGLAITKQVFAENVVVEMTPGIYKCTVYANTPESEVGDSELFVKMEFIGK